MTDETEVQTCPRCGDAGVTTELKRKKGVLTCPECDWTEHDEEPSM